MKKLFLLLAVAGVMVACGGGDKQKDAQANEVAAPSELKIKPESTSISGDLRGCFEVVDREYKLSTDGWGYDVNIMFKRTEQPLPFDPKSYVDIEFIVTFYDKDGEILSKVTEGSDDVIILAVDEKGSVEFTSYDDEKVAKAATFSVSSKVKGGMSNSSYKNYDDDYSYSDDDIYADVEDAYNSGRKMAEDAYNAGKKMAEDAYNAGLKMAEEAYGAYGSDLYEAAEDVYKASLEMAEDIYDDYESDLYDDYDDLSDWDW